MAGKPQADTRPVPALSPKAGLCLNSGQKYSPISCPSLSREAHFQQGFAHSQLERRACRLNSSLPLSPRSWSRFPFLDSLPCTPLGAELCGWAGPGLSPGARMLLDSTEQQALFTRMCWTGWVLHRARTPMATGFGVLWGLQQGGPTARVYGPELNRS